MQNPYRLTTNSMFERADELQKELPRRIVYLSTEGRCTEVDYFTYLNKYRNQIGIKSSVVIEPLSRAQDDNKSAPADVLELLEEYLEIRDITNLPDALKAIVPSKYSPIFIEKYLNGELVDSEKDSFETDLRCVGLDISYVNFLNKYRGDYDVFGLVLDRDSKCHTKAQLETIYQECIDKGYKMYLTTPAFEFWLLLHLADVRTDYSAFLNDFLEMMILATSGQHSYNTRTNILKISGQAFL